MVQAAVGVVLRDEETGCACSSHRAYSITSDIMMAELTRMAGSAVTTEPDCPRPGRPGWGGDFHLLQEVGHLYGVIPSTRLPR
jgi:hypothetical protein